MNQILWFIHLLQVLCSISINIKGMLTYLAKSLLRGGLSLKLVEYLTLVLLTKHRKVLVENHFDDVEGLFVFVNIVAFYVDFLKEMEITF